MIIDLHEVLSTRDIVERLMTTERDKRIPDLGYIQALEDVIFYDEQHNVRRHVIKRPTRFELTDKIRRAYAETWFRTIGFDDEDVTVMAEAEVADPMPWRDAALIAVLTHVSALSETADST